jgi:hypothetical protein
MQPTNNELTPQQRALLAAVQSGRGEWVCTELIAEAVGTNPSGVATSLATLQMKLPGMWGTRERLQRRIEKRTAEWRVVLKPWH